jgi:hypothetical protein
MYGITEAVARANGYKGPMGSMQHTVAEDIYFRIYWERPGFNLVAELAPKLAAELLDTAVNMGPSVASTFLQRALTALNRNGRDYPDLVPDGRIGPATIAALRRFLAVRGMGSGEVVLLKAVESLQGRALSCAGRAASGQRGIPLWLACEPRRGRALTWVSVYRLLGGWQGIVGLGLFARARPGLGDPEGRDTPLEQAERALRAALSRREGRARKHSRQLPPSRSCGGRTGPRQCRPGSNGTGDDQREDDQ